MHSTVVDKRLENLLLIIIMMLHDSVFDLDHPVRSSHWSRKRCLLGLLQKQQEFSVSPLILIRPSDIETVDPDYQT